MKSNATGIVACGTTGVVLAIAIKMLNASDGPVTLPFDFREGPNSVLALTQDLLFVGICACVIGFAWFCGRAWSSATGESVLPFISALAGALAIDSGLVLVILGAKASNSESAGSAFEQATTLVVFVTALVMFVVGFAAGMIALARPSGQRLLRETELDRAASE